MEFTDMKEPAPIDGDEEANEPGSRMQSTVDVKTTNVIDACFETIQGKKQELCLICESFYGTIANSGFCSNCFRAVQRHYGDGPITVINEVINYMKTHLPPTPEGLREADRQEVLKNLNLATPLVVISDGEFEEILQGIRSFVKSGPWTLEALMAELDKFAFISAEQFRIIIETSGISSKFPHDWYIHPLCIHCFDRWNINGCPLADCYYKSPLEDHLKQLVRDTPRETAINVLDKFYINLFILCYCRPNARLCSEAEDRIRQLSADRQ